MTGTAQLDRLIKLPEVIDQVGISRSQIYNLISLKRFPAPLKIGGSTEGIGSRSARWSQNQIQDWIRQQVDQGKTG
jgi:prophage regulatory protein